MRTRLSVGLIVLVGALGVGFSSGAATRAPHLYVTPSTRLHNHQVVKVRGAHFKPGDTVFITECLVKAKGASGCDIATATPVTIAKDGTFPWTKFTVHTGKVGSGTCGTRAINLKRCAVSAGNPSGGDSAVARVSFAAPKRS